MKTQKNSDPVFDRGEKMKKLFGKARIKKAFGMNLTFNDQHEAVFEMPFNPEFTHAIGDVHGGVIATLLDNAGWFTAAVHYDSWIATTDLHVRLLEPAKKEDLVATGRLLKKGKHLAMAEMEVRSKLGRLVATGSGTFAVTSVPLVPKD